MAATIVSNSLGISLNDPLDANVLNTKLRDVFQRNIDSYKNLPNVIPFAWDITEDATTILVDTQVQLNIPPGIVLVDMSLFTVDDKITLSFNSETGPRLILPINRDEPIDAQIVISCSGYKVNNSNASDLPVPNEFRVHPGSATLVGATSDRLFCKDGLFFKFLLDELEDNVTDLQELEGAEDLYVQLQGDLDSVLNLINSPSDNQADLLMVTLDQRRENAFNFAINQASTAGSRFNLYEEAEFSTLTDLTSSIPVVEIQVNHDMMKYILAVPVNANADSVIFKLVNGEGHPDFTFNQILLSISINARKAIPFSVDFQSLTGQAVILESDHDELVATMETINSIPLTSMVLL